MPGWRGKLSDDEIEAVIAWMQSLWPDDRYEAWYRMEHAQAQ
jgi:mono/diheme cytochrome c family protein